MTGLARDVRFGLRMLTKHPGQTVAAVLALALGIGLSTAMFSIVYGAVIRGLPFEESERLMHLENNNPSREQNSLEVLPHDFPEMRRRQRSFEGLAAFYDGTVNLSGDERPERYDGAFLSANSLSLLRVKPLLGRGFLPEDEQPGGPLVVLLGWGVWQSRYNGDPGVVNRPVRVNGEPATIVGVMPQHFAFPITQEIWVPLRQDLGKTPRGQGETLEVFGRLRHGVSLEQARTEMSEIARALATQFPETNEGRGAVVKPYTEEFIGKEAAGLLYTMLGFCLVVLMISCTNVAALTTARASQRTREIAIRSALGAERGRLVRQFLIETLLVSLLGTLLALPLAEAGTRGFNAAVAEQNPPFWIKIALDPTALLFATGLAVLAGVVSGVVPALQASRAQLQEVLKDEGRSSSLRMGWITRGIVIVEVAASFALLVGAGLMVQNVRHLQRRVDMPLENRLTSRIALFETAYPGDAERVRFFDNLLHRLRQDPAVATAAATTYLPGSGAGMTRYTLEGKAYPEERDHPVSHVAWVSTGFFEAFGAKVLDGRDFGSEDTPAGLPVVLVNRRFAEQNWPGQSPLGRRVRITRKVAPGEEPEPWRTVVGVVPDLGMGFLDDPVDEDLGFYIPISQDCPGFMSLVVQTRGSEPLAFTPRLREHVNALDRDLPLYFIYSMEQVVEREGFFPNLFAGLFTIFGLCALLLAAVGIYGVIAFSVHQRTQEIGIRMALGAERGSVLGLILRQGMIQLLLGLGIGLALAWPAGRLLQSFLVGVRPYDPPTFVGVSLLLGVVALLACWFPAQRASRTSPLVAIRYD